MACSRFQITDVRIALVFMAMFSIFSGGTVTYISAVLTTLEKRFEFNSMEMGALMGANDIGYLSSVIFVAYFGSKNNRQPIMLCLSGIGLWLSCMAYSMPYFIFGPKYDAESLISTNITSKKGLCSNVSSILTVTQSSGRISSEISSHEKSLAMFLLMIAGIINGLASTPFWSLGISFLDDMAGPSKSGIYIGTLFGMRTCSPIFGFLLGSHVLKYHESLKLLVSNYSPGQTDLKWIGAWWLGWIILGFCVLIPTPFMLLLNAKKPEQTNQDKAQKLEFLNGTEPHNQPENNNDDSQINTTEKNEEIIFHINELKKIFGIIRESLANKIFTSLVVGMIFEIISFICLFTFFTKFLEYHYRVPTSKANIMSAACLAGSSMVSAFSSGLTSHFYKTTVRNMNRYHAIVNTVSALMFPILFMFTCPSTEISGLSDISKASMCSDKCNCQIRKLEPVCYNKTTFFSSCLVGCQNQLNETFFSQCGCQKNQFAEKGFCEKMCISVYGFLIMFFIVKIIGSLASVQFTQVLMRLNNPKTKAVNLSLISFIYGICGLVLPPLAGMVLDTACNYRNVNKFGNKSHCIIYDNDKMRYLILGTCFALQIPGCIFYTIAWRLTPEDYTYNKRKGNKIVINSEFTNNPEKHSTEPTLL